MSEEKSRISCIFCGKKDLVIIDWKNSWDEPIGYKVKCCSCYAYGPFGTTIDEAIEKYKDTLYSRICKIQPRIIMNEKE